MTSEQADRRRSPLAPPSVLDRLLASLLLRFTASQFVIRHRPGCRATILGRIPGSKFGAIQSFFTRDLGAQAPPLTVCGAWSAAKCRGTGMLRLRVLGHVDARLQQRVRNFLLEVLH